MWGVGGTLMDAGANVPHQGAIICSRRVRLERTVRTVNYCETLSHRKLSLTIFCGVVSLVRGHRSWSEGL